MTNDKLERCLAAALEKCAPNDPDGVLSRCEERKGTEHMTMNGKKRNAGLGLIAACLALLLLGGGGAFYAQAYSVASVVSLDVNPSIELRVNRNEKVISCAALNAHAKTVLADMAGGADLKGAKLDVAVNAIVGALVRSGYLDSLSSAIMISVEDKDTARAERLQRELTGTVGTILQTSASQAAVLSQTVTQDAGLEQLARENSISTGRAALIERIRALNKQLQFDKLAALSVAELKELAEAGAPAMPIGCAAAAEIAEKYAGTLSLSSVSSEVDPELDEQPAHYEVELHTLWGEYDYKIDAYTGEVLSGMPNIVPAAASPGAATSVTPAATPSDIGAEAAKAAALKHAGLSAATFTEVERDDDDPEYELEFHDGTFEYEYTISGITGEVLSREVEPLYD